MPRNGFGDLVDFDGNIIDEDVNDKIVMLTGGFGLAELRQINDEVAFDYPIQCPNGKWAIWSDWMGDEFEVFDTEEEAMKFGEWVLENRNDK